MNNTTQLATFLAQTRYEDIPQSVIIGMKALVLDWFGSALAGKNFYPTSIFRQYAKVMGPSDGTSTLFGASEKSSPYFAAFVNGASGHLLEQDDLHNSSVFHPATVVFPAILAAGEDLNISGEEFLLAAVMGYEAGIRIGEYLGRTHYQVFHTTSTVGSISAAIAVGKLMNFDTEQMLNIIGNAATQSAGLWAFLEDAADSKQLHTAKANANGVLAAYLTKEGLRGAQNVLESTQGLGAGMSHDTQASFLADRLGERWASIETSFKFHASCRHTHPAGDALLQLLQTHQLQHSQITKVTAHVHQAALDVLGSVVNPQTIHQAKFSMGTVMGLLAVHGNAGLLEFAQYALTDPDVKTFRDKVEMVFDAKVDRAYPQEWQGKVTLETVDGEQYTEFLRYPKGDPQNPLSTQELEEKFKRLLLFSDDHALLLKSEDLISLIWDLDQLTEIKLLTALLSVQTH